ncbi:cysteine hydrolase [Paenibacillus sp. T3-5-0-4]|nr:cysteine hydrolase [Paenibacillus endoradicis]
MRKIGLDRNYWNVSKSHADLRRVFPSSKDISFYAEPQHVTINLAVTALVVIDMQNDFCSEGGWLDHIGADYNPARRPIDPLNALLPELRIHNVPIIWVNWGNREDRANVNPSVFHVYNMAGDDIGLGGRLPNNGSHVLEKGSWSAAIISELDTSSEDIYVDKYRMSGFCDTPLDSILRNLKVDTLLFAGVNLDQCVMGTLQDAVNLGYDSILLSDCSATNSPAFCEEATYYNVKQCYGFVASSTHLLAQIKT